MSTAISLSPSAPASLNTPRPSTWLGACCAPIIERAVGLPAINAVYNHVTSLGRPHQFIEDALSTMGITIDVDEASLAAVPRTGPLIVVANHPHGALDGMTLASLLRRVRPDVKLLANHMLHAVPQLAASCVFVDPFGGRGASRRNIAPMRKALRWVHGGAALIVFPAGEVSHWRPGAGITDPAWSTTIGRLIRKAAAPVLPVYFSGRNSLLFQAAGLLHPRLRTAMLPRELLRRRNSTVAVEIGTVIAPAKLATFDDSAELTAYLRARTYLLAGRTRASRGRALPPRAAAARRNEPIIDAIDPALLNQEIAALPPEHRLAQSGDLAVFIAHAHQVPNVITEIGRLREIAFRHVGEGTGRPLDLDRYDEHYQHLFIWNHKSMQIIGAYRLGLVDQIVRERGVAGVYTSTLFRFRDALLEELGDAIELGRSFVRIESQKEFAPLMLLWKGIGTFVARNPRYRRLFGPVSISNEYQSMTRWLLMAFLKLNNHLPSLARLVMPKNPPRLAPQRELSPLMTGATVRSLDEVGQMVDEIESGRRSMPVLLRQYLKLNAKLLGFNVDGDFGDVLDALMLVDLTQVDRAILVRYLGREGSEHFLAHHGIALA